MANGIYLRGILTLVVILSLETVMFGQYPPEPEGLSSFKWPKGKKCAVSLSFDDARPSQLDIGIPIFNRYGLKATFYVSPGYVESRVDDWKKVPLDGHEIGNHSMTHPCSGNFPCSRKNALENYTLDSIRSDIESANRFIKENLGVVPKNFAYPCGQKYVGRGENLQSYVPIISKLFLSGRGWMGERSNDPDFCDLSQVFGMELDGLTFDQAKILIDAAAVKGHWLILCGHEIGDPAPQTTLSSTIESICRYVSKSENQIWMDTVGAIGAYVKDNRTID